MAEVSHKITQPKKPSVKKAAFLAAYAQCGNITQAAEIAGCERRSHYDWLRDDPDYPPLFEAAHEEACDRLEQEARRRATEGWEEPVFHEGVQCGAKRRFSDTLLIFLMKGAMPEKYKDRVSQEISANISSVARIIEDDDWYGNKARLDSAAEADGASVAGAPESG